MSVCNVEICCFIPCTKTVIVEYDSEEILNCCLNVMVCLFYFKWHVKLFLEYEIGRHIILNVHF